MTWDLRWHDDAVRELFDISRSDRRQSDCIHRAVQALARADQGDVRKLRDRTDQWRLRVGDWRVIFTYDQETRILTVLEVRRRNEGTYRD